MRLPGYALDAVVVAAGLAYAAQTDSYGAFLLATVSLTALAAIGLNVLMGLSGQISFGHVGFMAIGAYATAILMERAGWPFSAAMPAAALLAGAIGGVLAVPALRVRGPYLAMVTIAFGFIVEHGAIEWRDLTGGGNGLILSHGPTLFGEKLGERGLAGLASCSSAQRCSAIAASPQAAGATPCAPRAIRRSRQVPSASTSSG